MSKKNFLWVALILAIIAFSTVMFFRMPSELKKKPNNKNKEVNKTISASKEIPEIKQPKNIKTPSMLKKHKVVSTKNENSVKQTTPEIVKVDKSDNDYVDSLLYDLEYAINNGKEASIQIAMEAISGCTDCIERMIKVLSDFSHDERFRQYVAEALIKPGTNEGVIAVVYALLDADYYGMYDFKDRLMQILADVDSADAVHALATVLTEQDQYYGGKMPDDVFYAVSKTMRLMSDKELVGEVLAQYYRSETTQEARDRLLNINHVHMDALLAAEAYQRGDDYEASVFMERLVEREDRTTVDAMMLLSRESTMAVGDVAELMYQWVEKHPNTQNHDLFVEYISSVTYTPEERAIAAYALSASKDSKKAIYALEKAYTYEEDSLVSDYIDTALSVIKSRPVM